MKRILIILLLAAMCSCSNKEYCDYKLPGRMKLMYSPSKEAYAVSLDTTFRVKFYADNWGILLFYNNMSHEPVFYKDSCSAKKAAKKYIVNNGYDLAPVY